MQAAAGKHLQVRVVMHQLAVSGGLTLALWLVLGVSIGLQFFKVHRNQLIEDSTHAALEWQERASNVARIAGDLAMDPDLQKNLRSDTGEGGNLPGGLRRPASLDVLLAIDEKGTPLFSRTSSRLGLAPDQLLKELQPVLRIGNRLLPSRPQGPPTSGFYSSGKYILLLGAAPLKAQGGWIVTAKLAQREEGAVTEVNPRALSVRLQPYSGDPAKTPGAMQLYDSNERPLYIERPAFFASDDVVLSVLNDPNGNPTALLRMVFERQLLSTALVALFWMGGGSLCMVLLAGLFNYRLMDRLVVGRISELSRQVSAVTSAADASQRVTLEGKDEIGVLARSINTMLGRMEAAQRDVEDSNARYRAAIEQSVEGIFLVERDGLRILEMNEALRSMLRTGQQSASAPETLYDIGLARSATVDGWIRRLEKRGGPVYVQEEIRLPSGAIREIGLTLGLLRYNRRTQILGVVHDLQEDRKLENAVQEAKRIESVGQLAGGVAHDFNNLLTVILNAVEPIRSYQGLPERLKPYLEMIIRAASNAAELTQKLLYFSRRSPTNAKSSSLNRLVQGIRPILRSIVRENIRIEVSLCPELPNCMLDEKPVEQCILNLVLNAKDAIPADGLITLRTGEAEIQAGQLLYFPDLEPGRYLYLEVSDSGPGMPDEMMTHLFEPFQTTKETGKGTGLGLPMVHGIMEEHNGAVDVTSAKGKGCTFRLYFPVPADSHPCAAVLDDGSQSLVASPRASVMVVEDQVDIRELTCMALELNGYRVAAVENADAALKHASIRSIDLLVTDVVMPGQLSGYDLANELLTRNPELKVIVMSGYNDAQIRPNGTAAAVLAKESVRFLAKPFTNAQLRELAAELLPAAAPV